MQAINTAMKARPTEVKPATRYIKNLVGDLYIYHELKLYQIARRIGPVFQRPHLVRLTVINANPTSLSVRVQEEAAQ